MDTRRSRGAYRFAAADLGTRRSCLIRESHKPGGTPKTDTSAPPLVGGYAQYHRRHSGRLAGEPGLYGLYILVRRIAFGNNSHEATRSISGCPFGFRGRLAQCYFRFAACACASSHGRCLWLSAFRLRVLCSSFALIRICTPPRKVSCFQISMYDNWRLLSTPRLANSSQKDRLGKHYPFRG